MPTIEELMKQPYARVLTPDENGGYTADILEIPDCFSEGDSADEAMENLEDALRAWLEVALEEGKPIPKPLDVGDYNGRILLRTPKWVHRECVRRAELDAVSLNQWLLQAISERLGAEAFTDRLLSRMHGMNLALFEQRTVTTEVSRRVLSLQGQIGVTSQLMGPNPEKLVFWTPSVKEPQGA